MILRENNISVKIVSKKINYLSKIIDYIYLRFGVTRAFLSFLNYAHFERVMSAEIKNKDSILLVGIMRFILAGHCNYLPHSFYLREQTAIFIINASYHCDWSLVMQNATVFIMVSITLWKHILWEWNNLSWINIFCFLFLFYLQISVLMTSSIVCIC